MTQVETLVPPEELLSGQSGAPPRSHAHSADRLPPVAGEHLQRCSGGSGGRSEPGTRRWSVPKLPTPGRSRGGSAAGLSEHAWLRPPGCRRATCRRSQALRAQPWRRSARSIRKAAVIKAAKLTLRKSPACLALCLVLGGPMRWTSPGGVLWAGRNRAGSRSRLRTSLLT